MLDLPLEYALVEFKGNKFSGKIVPELLDLAERGIVRFVDIVFIQKEKDGSVRTIELNDLDANRTRCSSRSASTSPVCLPPMTWRKRRANSARIRRRCSCLWENLWTANLRKAILDAGGKLVDRAQISPEVVKQFNKRTRRGKAQESGGEEEVRGGERRPQRRKRKPRSNKKSAKKK